MIKYPLYVTLDTNIFISSKFDFGQNGTLGLLIKYVESGKIKIVLSNIVIKEVERHITAESLKINTSIHKLRADILKKVSEEYLKQVKLDLLLKTPNKQELIDKSLAEWKRYIQAIDPEILDYSNINLEDIISDYFNFKPPFENNDKKRKEFPDAFIAKQINARFGSKDVVAIISNDKGFNNACGITQTHLFYNSLGELFDTINREEDEYQNAKNTIMSLISKCVDEINERIMDNDCVDVHGMTCDKNGILDGFDYDETYVDSVKETSCRIRTIDEISETTIQATLLCTSTIDVECFYNDYDNAIWDSETKSYFYYDTIEMFEKHKVRFGCRVEVNRDDNYLRIFPFKVILNCDSLLERFEVKENNNEQYTINQEDADFGVVT